MGALAGAPDLGEDAKRAQFFKVTRGRRFQHSKKLPVVQIANATTDFQVGEGVLLPPIKYQSGQ